jgi:signal transduction histidine kinase
MKLNWFEKIIFKNKEWLLSKSGERISYFTISCFFVFSISYILIFYANFNEYGIIPLIALSVILSFLGPILALFILLRLKKIIRENEIFNDNIASHQTENLQEYENIRTQFTLHNIKNAVINANNYMDILRKGKMDLTIATENLQGCLDRIDEILEVFKDSDYAQKRTEFRLEELFTTFQMLYHSTMIRRDIQFEVIYQNDAVKSQIVNQSFYDMFQIFNNLVINSRKAIEQKEIKQITVFANMDEQKDLIFKVCDTGVGISSSNKSKIFDLKFSTTGGDGIGLVYVKEVLKEMGGSIRLIESFQNFSTTFEVRIPIQKM